MVTAGCIQKNTAGQDGERGREREERGGDAQGSGGKNVDYDARSEGGMRGGNLRCGLKE